MNCLYLPFIIRVRYMEHQIVNEKEYILDFLQNCDRNSFVKLKEHTIKLREDAQLKPLPVKCIHCEHDYTQTIALNVSDFFE